MSVQHDATALGPLLLSSRIDLPSLSSGCGHRLDLKQVVDPPVRLPARNQMGDVD